MSATLIGHEPINKRRKSDAALIIPIAVAGVVAAIGMASLLPRDQAQLHPKEVTTPPPAALATPATPPRQTTTSIGLSSGVSTNVLVTGGGASVTAAIPIWAPLAWATPGTVVTAGSMSTVTSAGEVSRSQRAQPDVPEKVVPSPEHVTLDADAFAHYRAVAESIGVASPGMLIEAFRGFLASHHMVVYDLPKVAKYMDAVAARDNITGWGWGWAPVRAKDIISGVAFGQGGFYGGLVTTDGKGGWVPARSSAASDFFNARVATVYSHTIPLHALEKIALIEKEFGAGKVAFMVSDYATSGMIRPDPFLMAVVLSNTIRDEARFVIDAWDEPGFGLESTKDQVGATAE